MPSKTRGRSTSRSRSHEQDYREISPPPDGNPSHRKHSRESNQQPRIKLDESKRINSDKRRKEKERKEIRRRTHKRRKRNRSVSSEDSDSTSYSASSASSGSRRHKRRNRERGDHERTRKSRHSKTRHKSELTHSRHNHSTDGIVDEERVARKAARKAARMAAIFGYSNDNNPFGDSNLSEQFVWKKKLEKSGDLPVEEKDVNARPPLSAPSLTKHLAKKREETIQEIGKLRKRRDEREKEREEMERLRAEEQRLRDAAEYGDWQRKEEEFHLDQAKKRSIIRIHERREKPIDIVAKNILLFGPNAAKERQTAAKHGVADESETLAANIEMELREPYKIFDNLSLPELEELHEDILAYVDLEEETGTNAAFWAALSAVSQAELTECRRRAALDQGNDDEREASDSLHHAVKSEIEDMFADKSVDELRAMDTEIQQTIQSAKDGTVDVEYWENISRNLQIFKAKAYLREVHQEMLLSRLQQLEERKKAVQRQNYTHGSVQSGVVEEGQSKLYDVSNDTPASGMALARSRSVERATPARDMDSSAEAMALYNAEAEKGLDESEEALGAMDEVHLQQNVYLWQDKYRPRKPRYFNRVKTGYDWNKYNQTHYDHDNPPPKVVQGYKFNVFYPDLIDKSKAPRFFLENADSPDFCILRFSAGPPYEDIAFKIVNREWEYSHKRGFKSVFERGVLSLYFNFKRPRYRR